MFNEKALTILNRQRRRQQGGSGMDAIDREAEREGGARRFFKTNEVGPDVMGRRISKQTRELDGRRKTADNRATRNLVADTATALKAHSIPQYNLRQA